MTAFRAPIFFHPEDRWGRLYEIMAKTKDKHRICV